MNHQGHGCSWSLSTTDRAVELRRQARLVDDLMDRLAAVLRTLPQQGDVEGWRGPASEIFLAAVDEQRASVRREFYRLDSVRSQLRGAAALADAESLGGVP